MKKAILIPAFFLFFAASPNKIETKPFKLQRVPDPVSIKLDSANVKAAELNQILRSGL